MSASIPWSKNFGAWQVSGISSVSGIGGDASVSIQQQQADINLSVRWNEGGPIWVSAEAKSCARENDEFKMAYEVSVKKWLESHSKTEQRILEDFHTWINQIAFVCGDHKDVARFDLKNLKPALRLFSTWVKE
ncbi:hypothetical protein ACEWB4_02110 [Sphingobium sp. sgz301303]|uniref:hypothetical protein n=1 Tax=Sphingobium sp. sgz301304 TaxID=3341828 RepID=UPI0035A68B98